MNDSDLGAQAMPLLALIAAICGTHLLLIAWRAKERSKALLLVAWGLIFLSFYLWALLSTAADKGVALGVTAWLVIALIYLVRQAFASPFRVKTARSKSSPQSKKNQSSGVQRHQILGVVSMLLFLGPMAGLSAMILATLLFIAGLEFGAEYTAILAMATILYPILWAGLSVLLAYQRRALVRFFTVTGIGTVSLLCLYGIS